MDYHGEVKFVDSLLRRGVIKNETPEDLRERNEQIRTRLKSSRIQPPRGTVIEESFLTEAPPVEDDSVFKSDAPEDTEADATPDPSTTQDTPKPTGDSDVSTALVALFMTGILQTGDNFLEFNNEAMKASLMKLGVSEELYTTIGEAFYVLDTQSNMLPKSK
jgi:hypothetical protein